MLSVPRTVTDIATDGFLAQADCLALFHARFGEISRVQLTMRPEPDGTETKNPTNQKALADGWDRAVTVSFASSNMQQHVELAGTWAATIVNNAWYWQTAAVIDFPGIAELDPQNPQVASDELLAAGRTLFRNIPAVLVPLTASSRKDETQRCAVVMIRDFAEEGPVPLALTHGLAKLPNSYDVMRALKGFAVVRGLDFYTDSTTATIGSGDNQVTITVRNGVALDVTSKITKQLDSDETNVPPEPTIDRLIHDGRQFIRQHSDDERSTNTAVDCWALATVSGDTWTWAWADPLLANTPGAQESRKLLEFGIQNGVIDFVRPHIDIRRMRSCLAFETEVSYTNLPDTCSEQSTEHAQAIAALVTACAPITECFSHKIDQLDKKTTGVLVFSS
ncbi:hypothetical protein PQG65_02780 [Corynebacterium pseudodiphtheriticum]|uniref:DUF6882 domain-containing protein n=1 Tax=Corynebacterium pseudodiphtheriticum TaxID=37637 RepID=UPI001F60359E|nr:DUF6882 domain-containing protein [Corynebacterium pseudodiphtheriticum]MDC7110312.1 hypothetical protein [Corynebacterium pseudodiphtheriticum]MDC7114267.1 hypothetical protein [Corynebacterium pseudodiphtheriticum]MDK4272680.1 hypothetical protein [Corynebacterium pseudodiphtheriticum]MDK4318061.1 hypothetical protein [Corynebacterium pseudodiphtheriticum]UNU75871.1 hypothetical protein HH207_09240 [Corynebacterium pseudodiphtheriticum]